jgi:hypothetical protein
MGKRLLMVLIAALNLSVGWLYAQDSGDDSGDSGDTSEGAVSTDTSPGDISVTDVSNEASVSNDTLAFDPTNPTFDPVPTEMINETGPSSQFGGDFPTFVSPETPGSPSTPGEASGAPGIPAEPGAPPPPAHRAQIHAVIVSNLSDPSQVLSGNVTLTGGIIALGPPTESKKPGRWDPRVRIIPDPDLLNGSKIPPLVPNVIDVRITH